MKFQNYFAVLTMACALFASCSKSDVEPNEQEGSAYLSLNLVPNKSGSEVRSGATLVAGSSAESNVESATAYLFDTRYLLIKTVSYPTAAAISGTEPTFTTKAVLVPAATKFAFIVTGPVQPVAVVGLTKFGTLNEALTSTVAQVTAANQFMMTNAGVDGMSNIADEALVDVTAKLSATADAAEAAPATINVNRVVAKVEVKQNATSLTVSPAGATAKLEGWELDRTSKSFYPYARMMPYANASTNGLYRVCPSYSVETSPTMVNDYMNVSTSDYANTFGSFEYCHENTMMDSYQDKVRTTAVLIRATYVPAEGAFYNNDKSTLAAGDSYFILGGTAYTLAQVLAFKPLGATDPKYAVYEEYEKLFNGLKAASKISTMGGAETATIADWNAVSAKDALAITGTNITFYQNGYNYYRVLVRHDDGITGTNAEGKYGVVRNNWYVLTVNSINGLGSPWTPTPADDEKDDTDLWLSVTISVNDWAQWEQGVDL